MVEAETPQQRAEREAAEKRAELSAQYGADSALAAEQYKVARLRYGGAASEPLLRWLMIQVRHAYTCTHTHTHTHAHTHTTHTLSLSHMHACIYTQYTISLSLTHCQTHTHIPTRWLLVQVMPSVTEALVACARDRPADPVRVVAEKLLRQAEKMEAAYVDPYMDPVYELQKGKILDKATREGERAAAARAKEERELAAKLAAKEAKEEEARQMAALAEELAAA